VSDEHGLTPPRWRLPEDWVWLDVAAGKRFGAELRREAGPGHRLHGRDARAIARRLSQDDVLFEVDDGLAPLYVVHLTWRPERDPHFPACSGYAGLDDFCERWPREEVEEDGAGDDTAG
jgi:hypothetical protein